MEMDIKEKVERLRAKAEIFLADNLKAFIIDTSDNYYFCEIIFVGENCIHVQHFTGKKKFEKDRIFYPDIIKFEEYEKREERG